MRLRLSEIESAANAFYGLDLRIRNQSGQFVAARRGAYQAMRYAGYSFPEIGKYFGRDHSTVHNGCRPEMAIDDEDLRMILDAATHLAIRRAQRDLADLIEAGGG